RESTRARNALGRNGRKIHGFKRKYQAAWMALAALGWKPTPKFQELKDSDIRALDDWVQVAEPAEIGEAPTVVPGESRKTDSWIWKNLEVSGDLDGLKDICRVEWSKAWARKQRWDEELDLIQEEMRRTLVTLRHDASEWRGKVDIDDIRELESQEDLDEEDLMKGEGRRAYALRQAAIRDGLASKFHALWLLPDPKPRVVKRSKEVVEEAMDISSDESED
ncbi:hypothetical protein MPER_08604, partial [Moniliophthora perniciosa FA553]